MATNVGLGLSLFICFFMCIPLAYAEGYSKSMCNSTCPESNYNLICVEDGLINVTTVLVNINETCEPEPQRNDTYERYCETSLTEGYNQTALQQVKRNCDNKSECNLMAFVQNKMIGKVTVTYTCQANDTTATQRTTIKQESHVNTTESTTESSTQQIKVRSETSPFADSSEISVFTTKNCSLFPDVSTTQPDNRTFINITEEYRLPGNETDDMFKFPMQNGAITLSVLGAIVLAVIIVASIMKRRNHNKDSENDAFVDNDVNDDVRSYDVIDLNSHANQVVRQCDYDTVARNPFDQHSSYMSSACDGTYDHITHVSQDCLQETSHRQDSKDHVTQSAVFVALEDDPSYDTAASVRVSEFRLEDVPKDSSYTYSTVSKLKSNY